VASRVARKDLESFEFTAVGSEFTVLQILLDLYPP
jgi:hypothetical protein